MTPSQPTVYHAKGAWYTVGLLCALGLLAYVDRLAMSLLIGPIKADLAISDAQVGLLMGPAFSIVYAGTAVPLAFAVDRLNRKMVLAAGVILWSVSTALASIAADFETLFVLRMGVGIGEAVLSPSAVSLIGDLFVRARRSTPMASVMASQTIGAGISFILVAAILSQATGLGEWLLPERYSVPWRVTLLLVGLPGIAIALLLLTIREPARGAMEYGAPVDKPVVETRPRYFETNTQKWRFFVLFFIGGNLTSTPLYITAMWFPAHLIRHFELSATEVGLTYGLIAVVCGGIGALAFSALAERAALRGRKDILLVAAIALLPVALGLFLLACNLTSYTGALIAAGALQLIGNGIAAIPSVVVASLAAPHERGRLTSGHIILQALIPSAIAPWAVGFFSDWITGGNLGWAMTIVGLIVYPGALLFWLSCASAYRKAMYVGLGPVPASN